MPVSVLFFERFRVLSRKCPSTCQPFHGIGYGCAWGVDRWVALPKRETTLPEMFHRNGYSTWLVGRRHLAGVSHWTTEHARRQEYHHYDWAHGPLHRSRQNAYLVWLDQNVPDLYSEIFPSQANPDDTQIPPSQRSAIEQLPDDLSYNSWVGAQCQIRLEYRTDQSFSGIVGFVVDDSLGAQRTDGRALKA